MEDQTHTISVGFALAGTVDTLSPDGRRAFAEGIHEAVADYGLQVVFAGAGIGFDPTTGSAEPSFTLVAVGELGATERRFLEGRLGALAAGFGQDSVAFTSGATVFVAGVGAEVEA